MITISLTMLASVTDGELLIPEQKAELIPDVFTINQLVTDSRAIEEHSDKDIAFLALKGPSFDGHRFAQQVIEQGCQLLIVDHQLEAVKNVVQLVVNDTRIALGQIAAFVKNEVSPKTVGITGSSGKTTVKEMVAAILSRLGNVLATNGNFNNDIGVPLTLLRLEHSHDFAVIEMGANHMGEIAYTTALTQPDVAVINNIAAAHLEGFGDLCGVARAKGEIFSGLGENGVALYNQDTKYTSKWQWRLTDKTVHTFSCVNKADCYSENVNLDKNGCATFTLHTQQGHCDVTLPVPGKHNVCNAVASAAIAIEFGASLEGIQLGLAQMKPVKGRLNLHHFENKQTGCSIKLIDDSYNANLESAKAAAQLLSNYPGKQLLILGDMGELGSEARSYHQEVGIFAKRLKLNSLLSLGVLSQAASDAFAKDNDNDEHSQHFNQRTELLTHLFTLLNKQLSVGQQDIAILVKGSRSAHMEHVVKEILEWFEQMNVQKDINNDLRTSTENIASDDQSKEGMA
ncbi:UDP-N-acetylmuramoyl-tripeptide--D-alanyl-D-alanine ligase [Colwellia psychrerythraea]|uniref:UDP-N-acetylmuramoyl-tripeptide--D-alanyl-D-alanine ligase n=1 Tax=Colwellia psychrerythraea TaxID=28229 RepID=A0A099KYJ5_COLPS|nr:UDP-N-acetylmuramoyl-tripeptide--D-alanyl-D-alanine ligase [Colwellia psychrerythraea]KGJ95275.1 UDP-N-acetylmuramoylalanyl-D-glutamyl-2,6-diaminopimelate/D-alanyl-D-alanyl ligase [Colwellia psychrerythraea]